MHVAYARRAPSLNHAQMLYLRATLHGENNIIERSSPSPQTLIIVMHIYSVYVYTFYTHVVHAWRPNDDLLQRKNIFILNKTTISLDLCVYTCIGWIIIDQNYKCDIEQNEFKQVKNNKKCN